MNRNMAFINGIIESGGAVNVEAWLEDRYAKATFSERIDYSEPLEEGGIAATFHAELILPVERHDDYYCGIRANHFCVEIGWSEAAEGIFAFVTANHKGQRISVIFKV